MPGNELYRPNIFRVEKPFNVPIIRNTFLPRQAQKATDIGQSSQVWEKKNVTTKREQAQLFGRLRADTT